MFVGAKALVSIGKMLLEEVVEGGKMGLGGGCMGDEMVEEASDLINVEDVLGECFRMFVPLDGECLVGAVRVEVIEVTVRVMGKVGNDVGVAQGAFLHGGGNEFGGVKSGGVME